MADPTDDDLYQGLTGSKPPPTTTAPAATTTATASEPTDDDLYKAITTAKSPASASTPAADPQPTWTGIGKNIAAGAGDAIGGAANIVTDPSGNLVGKPLATAIVFAHDALAPFLGYQRFPDDVRNMLLGDTQPQPGTTAVADTAHAVGLPSPDEVPASGPIERIARKVTGNALLGGAAAPAAAVPAAVGAVVGDQAAQAAPDWAKPAVELTGNALGAGAAAKTGASVLATSPEVADVAAMARDQYGINLTAPQLGNPLAAHANDLSKYVPFSGYASDAGVIQGQYNRAWSRLIGQDSDKITPDVMRQAQQTIGSGMDAVEQNNNVTLDNTTVGNLARIETNARSSLPDSEYAVISRQLDNLLQNVQPGGTISGTTYGNLIGKGSPLDAAVHSSDSNIANYAGQIKSELQDSLSRSLSPEDAANYTNLRGQYKVLKSVVQPAMLRADSLGGASPSLGDISPAAVRQLVNTSYGSDIAQAAPGEVPARDLARIGQMMKEPGSSNTAERSAVLATALKAVELGSAALGGHLVGGLGATVGTPAAIMLGARLGGAALRSPWLANTLISRPTSPAMSMIPSGVNGLTNPNGQ